MTWLARATEHSATVHSHFCSGLRLAHVQLDEIRTRLRRRPHVLWLWLAIDPITKLIPTLRLGPRTQDAAHAVIHDLRQRLDLGCIPALRSDGLNHYFYALTAHFGQWVAGVGRRAHQWHVAAGLLYGQVKKRYRRRKLVRVTHVMRCSPRAALQDALRRLGLSGRLNTAFVERLKKDSAAECGGLDSPQLGNHAGSAAPAPAFGMVAGLLPLRARAQVAAPETRAAA